MVSWVAFGRKGRNMGEMIGRCPECGEHYYGWALRNPADQGCEICGCELEIYNYKDAAKFRSNNMISTGHSVVYWIPVDRVSAKLISKGVYFAFSNIRLVKS